MSTTEPNDRRPRRRAAIRTTRRRLAQAALFAAVRGLAGALGAAAGPFVAWWLTHH
ncbi:hypothetical protein [Actinomadura fibrosa]|uniref:MFS transporter n=1 Tax=Actinomadura fibrosa TaxID=111802 RepID=A0ABW2XVT2_9ACTN|nr:hypothetical protein [Actinomadura fibrosa]